MLIFPSAQVKSLFPIPGLTRDYTVKHTMPCDCIELGRGIPGWSCCETASGAGGARCGWQSQAVKSFALLNTRHECEGSGTASEDGRAAALLQAG